MVLGGQSVETVILITPGQLVDFVHGWREEEKERMGSTESGWLAVACPGLLSS